MKSAVYIAEGVTQFVLTAETNIDKAVLREIEEKSGAKCYRGSFYECRGGWIRFKEPTMSDFYSSRPERNDSDDSLIFRFEKAIKFDETAA